MTELSARRRRRALSAERMVQAIFGIIVYHELACEPGQLISEWFDRALEKHPVILRMFVIVTAAHLINWLPTRMDPYHHGFLLLKKGTQI